MKGISYEQVRADLSMCVFFEQHCRVHALRMLNKTFDPQTDEAGSMTATKIQDIYRRWQCEQRDLARARSN